MLPKIMLAGGPHLRSRHLPAAGSPLMRRGVPLVTSPRSFLLRAAPVVGLVATLTLTGAGIASAGVIGPDVSSNNHGNGSRLDWWSMHHNGRASFVFIKATEGGGYVNPAFASDFAAAARGRLARGAYHFARPSGGTHDEIFLSAYGAARGYCSTVGTLQGPGNLPPVLDLEVAGTLNPEQLTLWTQVWLSQVRLLTGRTPILYTNPGFWKQAMANSADFASYPLWLANYGVPSPEMVGGWKSFMFWQFTDSGRIAGAGSNVDMNLFNGSHAELVALTVSPAAAAAAVLAVATAAARSAAAAAASEAVADAAAAAMTTRYTTVRANPSRTVRTETTGTSPTLGSWLKVFGLDGSRRILGH
jgi:GH25 family lysozyme M1 (1,4-beta-N-acetylmuramidase)